MIKVNNNIFEIKMYMRLMMLIIRYNDVNKGLY